MTAITPLPPLDRASATFKSDVDTFFAIQLPTFSVEANAAAVAMNLNSTNDTSTTSNAIGLGAKTFTVTAGKSFLPGMYLVIADTAAPSTNSMAGQVTSYNTGTGSLVMSITSTKGSGTKTAWTISQSTTIGTENTSKNLLINSNFAVNQRSLSSPVGLGVGEVGHDGWKGGASGGGYSYTKTAGVTTINITAASLIQVVSGDAIKSGQYVLSWQGSALARINGGSYLSSPIVYTAVGGVNQTVEFQGGGTVALPKLELGTTPTVCELLKFEVDLLSCLPYRQKSYARALVPGSVGSNAGEFGFGVTSLSTTNAGSKWSHAFNPPMHAIPVLTLYSNTTGASGVISSLGAGTDVTPTVSSISEAGFTIDVLTGATTTDNRFSGHFFAEAPL